MKKDMLSYLIITLSLTAFNSYGALKTKEALYTMPLSSNPEEERVFVLNQIAKKINTKLRLEGVYSVLKNHKLIEKYQKIAKNYINVKSRPFTMAITNNLYLLDNLRALRSSNQDFNVEKEIKFLKVPIKKNLSSFKEVYMTKSDQRNISDQELSKDLENIKILPLFLNKKLNEMKENPDQLHIVSNIAVKELEGFLKKYSSPFYLESKPVALKINSILRLKKQFSFYRDFLNPSKKNGYINIMNQDVKEIRIGHATESKLNFPVLNKPNKKITTKSLNLNLGKSNILELINKDKNI